MAKDIEITVTLRNNHLKEARVMAPKKTKETDAGGAGTGVVGGAP